MSEVKKRIEETLGNNPVVLFMKGTPQFPQCGFSARAAAILKDCATSFHAVNVLEDDEIREGIKAYGNWPTIPQLYVHGQLVGGSDILMEMHGTGELQSLLSQTKQK